MKYLLTCILGFSLVARSLAAATNSPLAVAVFDFESKEEGSADMGAKVASLITANLSANPDIITVERAELQKLGSEQELGLSGTVSTESAAKIGQLTGAKVLVTGRVFKMDTRTIVVAKIIGTETSRVYGEIVQGPERDSLPDLCTSLAKKISDDLSSKGDTLVAKTESRADWMAELKKSLGGSTNLPVVSVNIKEQHYGPHIIDPAAQTELSIILQECGFKLADANSTNLPTVKITGEAFSALGSQHGNLISCTSRIEIKIHDQHEEHILLVDRQTSVGIDIAEQSAAKKALENAADILARRIIPKLANK